MSKDQVPAAVEKAHAAPVEPVIVEPNTKIVTNNEPRKPFEGTKVETHSAVQVAVAKEAEFSEEKLENGTVIRTYVGVQPGVVLTDVAGKEIA